LIQNEIPRTDVLMGEDGLPEPEGRDILRSLILLLTNLQLMIKPAFELGPLLEWTRTVMGEESTATWSSPNCPWLW
jgi:hypothetical protein